ncbi:uncharacterized protein [Takifugu rubripes]|uniref:uncharacterized protein n=1 Tax=Takifugu rubripes TaxID=31033 RepID=UPI001145C822|nr:uncharacterized protein LOC115250792 [Takifugu rubripes]
MWLRSVVGGSVLPLLCAAGELLIAATTLDVVIMSARRRAGVERLLEAAAGLVGLRSRLHPDVRRLFLFSEGSEAVSASTQVVCVSEANSAVERRRRRLYFTHSFARLWMTQTAGVDGVWGFSSSTEVLTRLKSGSANSVAARRRGVRYVLLSVRRDRPILTLYAGERGGVLRWYSPADQLRWLREFGRKAQARGDVVFLLLAGRTRPLGAKTAPQEGGSATLFVSTLILVFLWTFRPFLALCAALCFGWMVGKPTHRVLQRPPPR